MSYEGKPHYPVPALLSQLDFIAAEPMQAWEDFKAIGHYGKFQPLSED